MLFYNLVFMELYSHFNYDANRVDTSGSNIIFKYFLNKILAIMENIL